MNNENQYSAIVMYTISDDIVRNTIRDSLEKELGAQPLDESAYGIPYPSPCLMDSIKWKKYLSDICEGLGFDDKDFVKLYVINGCAIPVCINEVNIVNDGTVIYSQKEN